MEVSIFTAQGIILCMRQQNRFVKDMLDLEIEGCALFGVPFKKSFHCILEEKIYNSKVLAGAAMTTKWYHTMLS